MRPEVKGRQYRINKTGKVISHFLQALEWLGEEGGKRGLWMMDDGIEWMIRRGGSATRR